MPKITQKADKVAYVKSQSQTRDHHCHWPNCPKQVPPAMWGCSKHWYMLPKYLRDKVWAAYQPGQEINLTPSMEYLAVAHEVQEWITANYPEQSVCPECEGYKQVGGMDASFNSPPCPKCSGNGKVIKPSPTTISPKENGAVCRIERLAVNLPDLDRINPAMRPMLLSGKLDLSQAVTMDKSHPDEIGVAFSCDLLTAACICDTIRSHDRSVGDYPTRIYLFKKTWSKLSGNAVLSELVGNDLKLSSIYFPQEKPQVELVSVTAPVLKPLF